jgi:hypothetical protein
MPPCVVKGFRAPPKSASLLYPTILYLSSQKFVFFEEILGMILGGEIMNFWRKTILFYVAGCIYVCIELLWRGRSHGSMFVAGGVCCLLLGRLNEVEPRLPLPLRAALGAVSITAVELGMGLLVNRSYAVWDYRDRPGNLWGQICPEFMLIWLVLAPIGWTVYEKLQRRLP